MLNIVVGAANEYSNLWMLIIAFCETVVLLIKCKRAYQWPAFVKIQYENYEFPRRLQGKRSLLTSYFHLDLTSFTQSVQ